MREIKFRAWDGLRMTTSGIMFNTSTGCLEIPTAYSLNLEEIPKEKRMILMQYTGLKDKNGTEIYEGDICKAIRGEQEKPNTRYEIKGKVIWFRGGFEVFNKHLQDFYTDDKGNLKDCSWCWHGHNNLPNIYEEIIEIEIIGNIYENPELTNKQNH